MFERERESKLYTKPAHKLQIEFLLFYQLINEFHIQHIHEFMLSDLEIDLIQYTQLVPRVILVDCTVLYYNNNNKRPQYRLLFLANERPTFVFYYVVLYIYFILLLHVLYHIYTQCHVCICRTFFCEYYYEHKSTNVGNALG